MGNRVAPAVAISFMHILETSFLSAQTYCPVFYARFIDDCFGVWTHGLEKLKDFFNEINNHNPAIKFTMEHSSDSGQIAFLDTELTLHHDDTYTTEIFIKPMTAPIILDFHSAHPMSTKRAVLHSQMTRAIKLSSNTAAMNRSLDKICKLFANNHYPSTLINKIRKTCVYKKQLTYVPKNKSKRPGKAYMRLPYIDETVAKRVQGIITASKAPITVAWTSGQTLGKQLIRSALQPQSCPAGSKRCHTCQSGLKNRCTTRMVVYKIICTSCKNVDRTEFYIGESRRPVRYRFNEHLSDARLRKTETPLGDHILDFHPSMDDTTINSNFSIEILSTLRDSPDVKISESMKIIQHRPTMNQKGSSWPITKYLT